MGLIRYSCCHISGHHEPIHVKFGVWGFFIMLYWNIVMKMLKCKKENLMTSHFSTLWKKSEMVTLKRVKIIGKGKNHSKWVKNTSIRGENHSKKESDFSQKSKNHSKRVNFTFWRGQRGTTSCPSVSSPQKSEIHSFGVIFFLFGKVTFFFEWFHPLWM